MLHRTAVLCIFLQHMKRSHLLALQTVWQTQVSEPCKIWNGRQSSHFPTSTCYFRTSIRRFLPSESRRYRIFLEKDGGASESERIPGLGSKKAEVKNGHIKSFLYSKPPDVGGPDLCVLLSPPCTLSSFLLPRRQGSAAKGFWTGTFTLYSFGYSRSSYMFY